jgi:DNA polymerase elongation subunit (family B)/DNA-directed RNA polymerase subunit RPC12/RpoP
MKILLLDIETAPNMVYSWGLFKQNISINQIVNTGYTMCWAAKWLGDKKVHFSSVHEDGMEAMVNKIYALLDEADAVIHYNGEKFDMPTLNREFLLHGLTPPNPYHNIDLLRTVRKRFRFTSNKLDFVSQQLGLGAKVKHMGMDLWTECMAGNGKSWNLMKKYNIQDVKLLETLYKKLLPWIQNHPNHALYLNTDAPVCPNCGSKHVVKNGTETTLTMKYQRYRCQDCGTPLRGRYAVTPKEQRKHILTQSKK